MTNKYKKIFSILFFVFSFVFVVNTSLTLASSDTLLFGGQQDAVGQELGLGDEDPRLVIANVVRITLGFLGVIAVMLIMYAGWLYMTAGGESDKIDQAKRVLIGAIVGLVIIMASFALATFVLNRLYDATGGNGNNGGGCNPSCLAGYCCVSGSCEACGSNAGVGLNSYIIPPNGSNTYPMNTIGEVRFNRGVDENSGSFTDNANLAYNFVTERRIEFNNQQTCSEVAQGTNIEVSGNWANRPCFDPAVDYTVTVGGYVSLSSGELLNCALGCTSNFRVSPEIDDEGPEVTINRRQAMCAGGSVEISARAVDNYGVSDLEFHIDNQSGTEIFQYTGRPVSLSRSYSDSIDISALITSTGDYTIRVVSTDIAGNTTTEQETFTIWPAHCCNNELDPDNDPDLVNSALGETDIDCGGECGACEGSACAIDMDNACTAGDANCSTDLCAGALLCNCEDNNGNNCTNAGYLDQNGDPYQINSFPNCCVCRSWPVINNVSPSGGGICINISNGQTTNNPCLNNGHCGANEVCDLITLDGIPNGDSGSMVTISGENFGNTEGEVFFCSNMSNGDCIAWEQADLADNDNTNCTDSWSDTMIVAVVPNGAANGPIRIVTNNGLEEATDDDWGSSINDFVVNSFVRPGICLAENQNVSGASCTGDEDCDPYECIRDGSSRTCSRNQGYFEETMNYQGIGLSAGTTAYFGDFYDGYEAAYFNSSVFSGQSGVAQVPNIRNKQTTTFVINNNLLSNNIDFYKLGEASNESRIIYFDPVAGKEGQYVTVFGQGFGNPSREQIGINYKIFFDDDLSNNDINDESTLGTLGDFDFPDICDADSLWRDEEILVKVPALSDGNYYLVIKIDNKVELIDSSTVDDSNEDYETTFEYNDTYSLSPGLCRISPRSGQRSDEIMLYGENMGGDTTHRVMFGGEIINSFVSGRESGADTITTNVPEGVVDGNNNVRVAQRSNTACNSQTDCGVGWECIDSTCQAVGNSLTFNVGECSEDAECGDDYVCCSDGSLAQTCQEGDNEEEACYRTFSSCVYEFDFNTSEAPPIPPNLDSCAGFGAQECGYNYCPNSPGWCSWNQAPDGEVTNACDDDYCDNLYSGTTYNRNIDKCVDGNQCSLREELNIPLGLQNYTVEKYCAEYNGDNYFHYRLSGGTCDIPESTFGDGIINWENIGNNVCVHVDESCELCSGGTECLNNNGSGVCGYDRNVCAGGYYCNTDGECQRDKEPCCDCCCDINQNTANGNPGCCAPLQCGFDCGAGERDIDGDGNMDIDFGLCTGCTMYDNRGDIDIDASDEACNCSESDISGKYCDTAAAGGRGVCRDCASLEDDFEDCSEHNTCCVDNKDSDYCRGVGDGIVPDNGINYCAYYSCGDNGTGNDVCLDQAPTRDGDYWSNDCEDACGRENGSRMGSSCYYRNDILGIDECTYDFCPDFYCMDDSGAITCDENGCTASPPEENCGICCCQPDPGNDPGYEDKCALVDDSLSCLQNVSPCSGDNRGMCCGCSEDSDCSIGTPDNIGCGDDSCCRARPYVDTYYPPTDDVDVCRNTLIQANFSERMDEGSLAGNLIVVGDYGLDPCPENTNYLVYSNGVFKETNIFARNFKKLVNTIVKPLTGKNAYAANNFCAISGATENVYNSLLDQTTINFNVNNLLDVGRDYYVIIKGDQNLNSSEGVLSFWGIGMVETNDTLISSTNGFNGLDFTAAKIWKFTAGDTICTLDSVDVRPDNHVFKLDEGELTVLGKTQDFTAYAMTNQSGGGEIVGTAEYGWTWSWSIDNTQVIDFDSGQLPSANPQTVVAQNLQDAATYINAEAVISIAPSDMANTVGQNIRGRELVRVFACNNPWPPIDPVNGWQPWSDSGPCDQNRGDCLDTHYEIYYCRDSGEYGTSDDLPAILSDTVTIGYPLGGDMLKEAYFFREAIPEATTLQALPSPLEGERVSLDWTNITIDPGEILDYYKVYYGEGRGNYTENITTTNPNLIIDSLVNDRDYYFVVTAVYVSGAESEYSNEVSATPHDLIGPTPPVINGSTPGNGEVSVDWSDASNGDAVAFRIYYVAIDNNDTTFTCDANTTFGGSMSVAYAASGVSAVVGLNYGIEYCLGMVGYDESGNSSNVSVIGEITPEDLINNPANLSAIAGDEEISLSWDLDSNAEQYRIYVGTVANNYTDEYLTMDADYTLSGLTNGDQYFIGVSSISFAGTESSLSLITAIPSDGIAITSQMHNLGHVFIDWPGLSLGDVLTVSYDVVNPNVLGVNDDFIDNATEQDSNIIIKIFHYIKNKLFSMFHASAAENMKQCKIDSSGPCYEVRDVNGDTKLVLENLEEDTTNHIYIEGVGDILIYIPLRCGNGLIDVSEVCDTKLYSSFVNGQCINNCSYLQCDTDQGYVYIKSRKRCEKSNCVSGDIQICGIDIGICKTGTQTCVNNIYGECLGAVNPSDEICDGLDNDCNGQIDNNLISPKNDNQKGVCLGSNQICKNVHGWQNRYTDILNYEIEESLCDQLDNDCDGQIDEGCCQDDDNDGYYPVDNGCAGEVGFKGHNDCNDANKYINPGMSETCDGYDNNCNDEKDEGCDTDKDGYCDNNMKMYNSNVMCPKTVFSTNDQYGDDCNDESNDINPSQTEICGDGIDNDCDELTTDYCDTLDTTPPTVDYFEIMPRKIDSGDDTTITFTVSDETGLKKVELYRSPDDVNQPGQPKEDGWIRLETKFANEMTITGTSRRSATDNFIRTPSPGIWWYGIHVIDTAYINEDRNMATEDTPIKVEIEGSANPDDIDDDGDGYTENEGDCNDTPNAGQDIHPGANEVCGDSIDNDCDGEIDEIGCVNSKLIDDDGDGYTENEGDCDDANINVNPGVEERCDDAIDNNCNNKINEDCLGIH